MFGTVRDYSSILAHLVPPGSPTILLPLIVLVESVSLLIRPITLRVRLAANIIAGHLLLTLCGSICRLRARGIIGLLGNTILGILEVAVAGIQAYVMVILLCLYADEVSYRDLPWALR
jgi:F-type H+-transporting ATPase subunit a